MFFSHKILILVTAFYGLVVKTSGEAEKRDLTGPSQALDFLHIGNFGPISRLSTHPLFAPLRLNPQQTSAFVTILLENGVLNPAALRLNNGQPLVVPTFFGGHQGLQGFNGNFFGPPVQHFDPYFSYLLGNYPRFLPFGLGSQGFYGTTGLVKPKPLGVLQYNNKN